VRRCAEKIAFTIMLVKRRAKKTLFAAAWARCREWGRMSGTVSPHETIRDARYALPEARRTLPWRLTLGQCSR
jgi:hypothetical protein